MIAFGRNHKVDLGRFCTLLVINIAALKKGKKKRKYVS